MKTTDIFANISEDLERIGPIRSDEFLSYPFCTPENAVIFAGLGVDGIHFCMIPEEDDLTLERSPVYVVSPMDSPSPIQIVAENFYDFASILIKTKDIDDVHGYVKKLQAETDLTKIKYVKEVSHDTGVTEYTNFKALDSTAFAFYVFDKDSEF